jgi:glycosyltransferase involved in cell wall biosynthesis
MQAKAGPSRAARVCIITPTHLGSTPRVVKEAQALHDAGFNVTVIALRTLDRIEPRDQSILTRAAWRNERIDLRSKYRRHPARFLQLISRRAYAATGISRFADFAFSAFTPGLVNAALRAPAELYIAHYPPALPAAAAAARRHAARFAFDAEDFHPGDWPDEPAHDTDRALLHAVESRYLPMCAHVTAASPGIAEAYAEIYNISRPSVVLNTFPLIQAPPGPTPRGSAAPGPSVYWFSQVIGPNRGLESAVRAIGLARTRPHLYLRGNLAEGFSDVIKRVAEEAGADGRVHILAPETPDQMERLAASYDIGLVAETAHTRNRQIALTNKLFTYLLAGVPAIMSDIAAHRTFAAETGTMANIFPVENHSALAARFDALLSSADRLRTARSDAYRLSQTRFNWETDSRLLVETVMQSLGNGRTPNGARKAAR